MVVKELGARASTTSCRRWRRSARTRVALRGLIGRKFRAVLTALAIVLGVAMVSGTYVLTDTIDKAFNQIFRESYAGTDAVVTGKEHRHQLPGRHGRRRRRFPRACSRPCAASTASRSPPGASSRERAKILDRGRQAISGNGARPSVSGSTRAPKHRAFNPLNLLEGRWAAGPTEVVIDARPRTTRIGVGDRVRIASLGSRADVNPRRDRQVPATSSRSAPPFAVFDIPNRAALFDRPNAFDAIRRRPPTGHLHQLVTRIDDAITADVAVKSAVAQANEESEEVAEFTKFIEYFLLALGGIALFVGAFVIFNTIVDHRRPRDA